MSPSPTILKRVVHLIKQAGGKSEAKTKRDGFLSYHAETHAMGMGIAAGWFAAAQGSTELLGIVYAAAVYGRAHASNGKRRRILMDIVQEPHYALFGAVAGAVTGAVTSSVLGISDVPRILTESLPVLLSLL
jgi:hypothetical protein